MFECNFYKPAIFCQLRISSGHKYVVVQQMAPRKSFSPFNGVICPDFSSPIGMLSVRKFAVLLQRNILSGRQLPPASRDSGNIRLQDYSHYTNKRSSNKTEIFCSSVGLNCFALWRNVISRRWVFSPAKRLSEQNKKSNTCGDENELYGVWKWLWHRRISGQRRPWL